MRIRTIAGCALGVALIAGSTGWAQEPTRTQKSETRIKVSKGEVDLPRVDTVVRTDTLYLTRYDTIRVPTIQQQAVRVDTVLMTVPAPKQLFFGGPFYLGLYTGPMMPYSNIDRVYTTGLHYGLVAGWEGANNLLGFRVNSDFSHLGREQGYAASVVGTTSPMIFTVGADLKVIPWNGEKFQLYGVGGGNFNAYRGVAMVSKASEGVSDGRGGYLHPVNGNNWSSAFGFNVGGGADFTIAGQELFLEARAMATQRYGARTWFVPVALGLRYF